MAPTKTIILIPTRLKCGTPAPGRSPTPRGRGFLFLMPALALATFGMAAALGPFEESKSAASSIDSPEPADRALRWLGRVQNGDGSFGTGQYLPRELETVLVLGLVAASDPKPLEAHRILDRAFRYFTSVQRGDGGLVVEGWGNHGLTTAMALAALAAYRDWKTRRLERDAFYVEAYDPRDLRRFFASGASADTDWADYVTRPNVADTAAPSSCISLFYRAIAAGHAGKEPSPDAVDQEILAKQRPEGNWATSRSLDEDVLETAYALRTLRLLGR